MTIKVVLEIMTEVQDDVQFVWTSGRIDGVNASEFVTRFEQSIDGDKDVVLDLHHLRYISSAGLRGLLIIARKMHDSGKFVICGIPPHIIDVFKVTGMDKVLNITGNRKQALELVQATQPSS